MSYYLNRESHHNYGLSSEINNEAVSSPSSFGGPRSVGQSGKITDLGQQAHHSILNESSNPRHVPRYVPTPRIPITASDEECSRRWHISAIGPWHSTGLHAVSSSKTMKAMPDAPQLSVPSTSGHQRHDSHQEPEPTSRDSAVTTGSTSDDIEHDSRSPSPGLTADNIAEPTATRPSSAELRTAFEALQIRGRPADDVTTSEYAGPACLRSHEARIRHMLQEVREWTLETGDTTLLESLHRSVSLLSSSQSTSPLQLGGHEASPLPSGSQYYSDANTSSNNGSSSSIRGNGKAPATGNESSEGRKLMVKLARKTPKRSTKIRCPLYFIEEGQRCRKLDDYPRDVLRHLKSHSLFFCTKCSKRFASVNELDEHTQNQVCNRSGCHDHLNGSQSIVHQVGCPVFFENLKDTKSKWYALFGLIFPGALQPSWGEVEVAVDANGAVLSPSASDDSDLPCSRPSRSATPFTTTGSHLSSNPLMPHNSLHALPSNNAIDRQAVEQMVQEIHNYHLMYSDTIYRQDNRIRNLEMQVDSLLRERQLPQVPSISVQLHQGQSGATGDGAAMEVDSHGAQTSQIGQHGASEVLPVVEPWSPIAFGQQRSGPHLENGLTLCVADKHGWPDGSDREARDSGYGTSERDFY